MGAELYYGLGAVAVAPFYLAYAPIKVGKRTWRWAAHRYRKEGMKGELKAWAISNLAKYSSAAVCVGGIILILPVSVLAGAVFGSMTIVGLMIMGAGMDSD